VLSDLIEVRAGWSSYKEHFKMAAMKPRGTDGPMEAEVEPRGLIVLKVPVDGGGRLVFSMSNEEVTRLYEVLDKVVNR
jgi:hypothetical protein